MLVDPTGLPLAVSLTAARVTDCDGATGVVAQACATLPSLETLFVDGACSGQCARALHQAQILDVQVVRHPGNRNACVFHDQHSAKQPVAVPTGFLVRPTRRVVEPKTQCAVLARP